MGLFSWIKGLLDRASPYATFPWEAQFHVGIDDNGVTTDYPGSETPRVAWNKITSIFVLTNTEGPFYPDCFWCFASKSDQLILSFPIEAQGLDVLKVELQGRFAGIDFDAFDVSQSTKDNVFLLWGTLPDAE